MICYFKLCSSNKHNKKKNFKAYSNGLSLKNVEELKKRSELQVKLAEQFEDFKDDMIAEVNCLQEKYDGWKKQLYKSYFLCITHQKMCYTKNLSQLKLLHF